MYREKLIEQLKIFEEEQQRLIKKGKWYSFRDISKDILDIARKIDELDQKNNRPTFSKQ